MASEQEVREALVAADSIMSLIRWRRTSALNEQDIRDLDAAISKCRTLTEQDWEGSK